MNYDSPKEIAALLAGAGLSLKKRFGQNFLVAKGAREKIVSIIDPKAHQHLWEIGPGIGSMTALLAGRVARLTLFEIDRGFARYLDSAFGGMPGVRIVIGDFLDHWRTELSAEGRPDLVFGNLPYASASAILAALIEGGGEGFPLVVTVQREAARRMAARPGSSDYSSFSILCQSAYRVVLQGDLKPGSFYPAPKVLSTIVELQPRKDLEFEDRSLFLELTRALFEARRKTLRNNLVASSRLAGIERALLWDALAACGIAPELRAERLGVEQVVELSNRIARLR